MSDPLRLEVLIPRLKLGPLTVDLRHLGGTSIRELLGPVLDGEPRVEGDHTVWPVAVPDGVTVGLHTPAGPMALGATHGALVLDMPPMAAHAWLALSPPPTRFVQHLGDRTRVGVDVAGVGTVRVAVPGVGCVGVRARC